MLESSPIGFEERRKTISQAVEARKAAVAARKAAAAARRAAAGSIATAGRKAPIRRTKGLHHTKTRKQATEPSERVRRSGRTVRPSQRLQVSTHHDTGCKSINEPDRLL